MSKIYKIKYKFSIEKLNDEVVEKTIKYFESRRFKCQLENKRIVGKRGNTIGNLFSYDMTKLICNLNVEFFKNDITVEFFVNSKFQDITKVNLASFEIEQLLLPYYLNNEPKPDFLNEYLTMSKESALKWTLSLTILGRKLPDELKTKIESLANENEYPEVTEIK